MKPGRSWHEFFRDSKCLDFEIFIRNVKIPKSRIFSDQYISEFSLNIKRLMADTKHIFSVKIYVFTYLIPPFLSYAYSGIPEFHMS